MWINYVEVQSILFPPQWARNDFTLKISLSLSI